MRISFPVVLGMLVLCLLMGANVPAGAYPMERSLDGISVGATYLEVLITRGAPHGVGPVTGNSMEIWNLLDPPPVKVAQFFANAKGFGLPSMSAPRISVYASMEAKGYRLRPETVVWEYLGTGNAPNPLAPFGTYVIFSEEGTVKAVVVAQRLPNTNGTWRTQTVSGVNIGTTLDRLAEIYDWPDPLISQGSQYFCTYANAGISYALDAATRKVVTMSVGAPLTIRFSATPVTPAAPRPTTATPAGPVAPVRPVTPGTPGGARPGGPGGGTGPRRPGGL